MPPSLVAMARSLPAENASNAGSSSGREFNVALAASSSRVRISTRALLSSAIVSASRLRSNETAKGAKIPFGNTRGYRRARQKCMLAPGAGLQPRQRCRRREVDFHPAKPIRCDGLRPNGATGRFQFRKPKAHHHRCRRNSGRWQKSSANENHDRVRRCVGRADWEPADHFDLSARGIEEMQPTRGINDR